MIRFVLCGALAATTLALPARAESPLEFIKKEAAETVGAAKAKPGAKRAEGRRNRFVPRGETVVEGRASTRVAARAEGGGDLQSLVARHAAANGVPQELAHGVVMVESRYNAKATGPGGYIGLMQISYRTAQGMGYSGARAGLYDPETNLRYGMKYLGEAYRQAGGNMCGAVSKYQGGHGVRGVTKAGAAYCGKVRTYMAQRAPGARQVVAERGGERS